MASAVIASQNESSWAHMGKIPYHLNANPNPKKKPKQHHNAAANGIAGHYRESPAVTQTVSDDAYSFNQTSTSRDAGNYGRYLTFNVESCSKSELLELRKRLSTELEQIRDLQNRINSGQFCNAGNPRSQAKFKKHPGKERPVAAIGSVLERQGNGFHDGISDAVDFGALLKECSQIVTKLLRNKFAYIFKAPVNAAALGLHDYHQIVKKPMDLGTVKANLAKNLYRAPREFADDVRLTFNNALLYNPKHDPVHGMALEMLARFEEFFRPIQQKIDSCVKQRREREIQEFRGNEDAPFHRNDELQGNSWSNHNQSRVSPFRGKKVKKQKTSPLQAPPQFTRKIERMQMPVQDRMQMPVQDRMQMPMQAHSSASTSSNPPPLASNHQPKQELIPSPVRAPLQPKDQKAGRSVPTVKQPKPKAKDPNKREMSMEEKQKLGIGLQSLPQEKMPQLVQIIKKRNEHLAQDGDEIELDIEALDTETLWELDRFVTNYKKMVSKTKRQALMMSNDPAGGIAAPSSPTAEADMDHLSDKNEESPRKLKDNEEEDVDIDDDMPATSFPPVMIEKDEGAGVVVGSGQGHHDGGGNASSSSSGSGSSSSSSSSSSGSDSGSSSGSDSDADDAQS
ncbi:global transcription factor group E7 [Perilla frutescens var. frutescens]|nr:global transcription factor group E7 [Perilla frutescens var. frutescens]